MRKTFIQLVSITGLLLFGSTMPVWAQRTIFNVPQADIIEAKKLFFQQQITVTDEIQSATIFTYGLGKSWEIGLNLNNVTLHYHTAHQPVLELHSEEPEQNPDLTVNIQKGIHFTDWFDLGIGTRTGVGYTEKISRLELADFSYLNGQFIISGPEIKLYAGGYYTTPDYAGEGNAFGYMAAVQVPIIQEKLFAEGEIISGTNIYSNITGGLVFQFSKRWQLAAGVQIPAPGSKNPYGATLQLSNR